MRIKTFITVSMLMLSAPALAEEMTHDMAKEHGSGIFHMFQLEADYEPSFWQTAGTNLKAEYARYYSVIHLRSPAEDLGYNHQNPLRVESASQAEKIDEKIFSVWSKHPRYHMVESATDFLTKAKKAINYIVDDLPECCRSGFADYKPATFG